MKKVTFHLMTFRIAIHSLCLLLLCSLGYGSEVIFDDNKCYAKQMAYIIQSTTDSSQIKNPQIVLSSKQYRGLKSGYWVNVAAVSPSAMEMSRLKKLYPQGYLKNLGAYRHLKGEYTGLYPDTAIDWLVESNAAFVHDKSLEKDGIFYHYLYLDMPHKTRVVDTFSISLESGVNKIHLMLYQLKNKNLVVSRSYTSPLVGSVEKSRFCMQGIFRSALPMI